MIIFGKHDDNTLIQLADVNKLADRVALMADGHLGYVMPIGGVAAYRNATSVTGVGFDIACGNAAILSNLTLDDFGVDYDEYNVDRSVVQNSPRLIELANEIEAAISFGIGRSNLANDAPVDDALFKSDAWDLIPNTNNLRNKLRAKARDQLGTVGSGNHYVDVFVDEKCRIWVGVHFGSRGLGHTIASNFLAIANGGNWGDKPGAETPAILNLDTPAGSDYWALMNLAGDYAYAGREWVARKVVELAGGYEMDLVHNHHNFAWKETHFDEEFIVVRKGATPAFPGQRGFVGGSMGDCSVILEGVQADNDELNQIQREAMYSTVHGAGRVMSRTKAAGKWNRKTGEMKSAGLVSPEMMRAWLDEVGVILRGGGLDESPHAYRRLPDVLQDQRGTVEVLHELSPLIVAMAPSNSFDPYKD
jgi:tRNA-splicing ligase RtcB